VAKAEGEAGRTRPARAEIPSPPTERTAQAERARPTAPAAGTGRTRRAAGRALRSASRLLAVALLAAPGAGARAASIDAEGSSLAGADLIDLSDEGRVALELALREGAAAALALELEVVTEDAAERSAPLVLEGVLTNLTGTPIQALVLSSPTAGVEVAATGPVLADASVPPAAPSLEDGAATVLLPGGPSPTWRVELGDPLGRGTTGGAWSLDASGLAEERFRLRLQVTLPEPGSTAAAVALLTGLGILARRRQRGHAASALGAAVLAAAWLASPPPARAAERIVTDPVDGSFGSLRNALQSFAEPGDTITFDVGEVVLDSELVIPAELAGLTLQGPVAIRAADGGRAFLDVQADGVTLDGVTFHDTQVSTPQLQGIDGLAILGSRFLGQSLVFLAFDTDCLLRGNDFDVDPGGAGDQVISLFATRGCRVLENGISSPLAFEIEDDDSLELEIRDNQLSASVFSRQRSGAITGNAAFAVEVVPNDGEAPGPLRIADNDLKHLRVIRTDVEVVENRVDPAGADLGRIDVAVSVANVHPFGGSERVLVQANRIRNGRLGLLYSEGRAGRTVPGEVSGNDVAGCSGKGIGVRHPRGTSILDNRVDDCGTGLAGVGLEVFLSETPGTLAEGNAVTAVRGAGIGVVKPRAEVLLRDNQVSGSAGDGLALLGGPARALLEDNRSTGNERDGVRLLLDARARLDGDTLASNGGAGVKAFPGTLVEVRGGGFSDNAAPGIDLAPDGVTSNPVTKLASNDLDWPEELRLDVPDRKLEGRAAPGSRVEVYRVEAPPRAGNPENGEGAVPLGAVTAGPDGHFAFPAEGILDCPPGEALTLTDTVPGPPGFTSEFSPDFPCDDPPTDTDGDSVTDGEDACPDTPADEPADEQGCAEGQTPDSDGDGVADPDDRCPDTDAAVAADARGCAQTVPTDAGPVVYCNDPDQCFVGPGGGSCLDCFLDGLLDLDCFDGPAAGTPLCAAGDDGSLQCQDCGVGADNGIALDCSDALCSAATGGELRCEGEAGGCEIDYPDGSESSCPPDIPCRTVIVEAVIQDPVFPGSGHVTIEKRTEGGDGSFDFRSAATVDPIPIETSGGEGVVRISYSFGTGPARVYEVLQEGWELESIDCDTSFSIQEHTDSTTGEVDGIGLGTDLAAGEHVQCVFTNVRAEGSPLIEAGGVTLPEAIERTGTFGLPPGDRVLVAGSNGIAVVDAKTGEVPTAGSTPLGLTRPFDGYQDSLGALVVERPDGSGADGLFVYGTNGASKTQFIPSVGGFGITQILFSSIVDAVHLGGDVEHGEALVVDPVSRDIGLLDFSAESPDLGPLFNLDSDGLLPGLQLADVDRSPVSAFAPQDRARVLVATDGAPGKLVLGDPAQGSTGRVVVVGDLGDDPRRLRCLAGVCAVSNFGSDSLTLATWDGGDAAAITAEQPVGAGPLGVDLRPLDGGDLLVATGLFGEDAYALTRVAPDGSVVASETRPAPEGCVAPGFAVWLDDGEGTLVLSCNGSDALAVFAPPSPAAP